LTNVNLRLLPRNNGPEVEKNQYRPPPFPYECSHWPAAAANNGGRREHRRAPCVANETINFMRKLDVKEIRGYRAARGVKVLRPDRLGEQRNAPPRPQVPPIAAE
jgi:hypothetical protein